MMPQQQAENSLIAYLKYGGRITGTGIKQWLNCLHPSGKFFQFSKALGIKMKDGTTEKVKQIPLIYLTQVNIDEDSIYRLFLSREKEYWKGYEEIYRIAFEVYKNIINDSNNQEVSDAFVKRILYLKQVLVMRSSFTLKDLVSIFNNVENSDSVAKSIVILMQGKQVSSKRELEELVSIFDNVENRESIAKSIAILMQTGYVVQGRELKELVSIFNNVENRESIAKSIAILMQTGFFIPGNELEELVSIFNNAENRESIAKSIATLRQAGLFISRSELKELVPVLNKVKNINVVEHNLLFLHSIKGLIRQMGLVTLVADLSNSEENIDTQKFVQFPIRQQITKMEATGDEAYKQHNSALGVFKLLVDKGYVYDEALNAAQQGLKSPYVYTNTLSYKVLGALVDKGHAYDEAIKAVRLYAGSEYSEQSRAAKVLYNALKGKNEPAITSHPDWLFITKIIDLSTKYPAYKEVDVFILPDILRSMPKWEATYEALIEAMDNNKELSEILALYLNNKSGVTKLFTAVLKDMYTLTKDAKYVLELMHTASATPKPAERRDSFNNVYHVIKNQGILSADLKSPKNIHWPNYHDAYNAGATDAELAKLLIKEQVVAG